MSTEGFIFSGVSTTAESLPDFSRWQHHTGPFVLWEMIIKIPTSKRVARNNLGLALEFFFFSSSSSSSGRQTEREHTRKAGERGRGRERKRERERERERILSRLYAQPTQGSIPWPWDHDLSQNQELVAQLTEPPRCPALELTKTNICEGKWRRYSAHLLIFQSILNFKSRCLK